MINTVSDTEFLNELKKKNKKNRYIEIALRAWAAGAVYFFIGWGTQVAQSSIFDFVFFLGVSLAIFDLLVITPVVNGMLKNELRNHNYSIKKGSLLKLANIIKNLFIVVIMVNIYNIINLVLITLLNLSTDAVPFAGEPITFGIIYIILWLLIDGLVRRVQEKVEREGV